MYLVHKDEMLVRIGDHQLDLRENGLVFECSFPTVCLSRACLGQIDRFIQKRIQKSACRTAPPCTSDPIVSPPRPPDLSRLIVIFLVGWHPG